MSQPNKGADGVWVVARLLAGAPPAGIDVATLAEPWASLAQAVANARGDERLKAFEVTLASLPHDQAATIRAQVGRVGRAILQGRPVPGRTGSQNAGGDVPDLPQAACYFLGYSIGEVFVLGRAQILEGQHDEHDPAVRRGLSAALEESRQEDRGQRQRGQAVPRPGRQLRPAAAVGGQPPGQRHRHAHCSHANLTTNAELMLPNSENFC